MNASRYAITDTLTGRTLYWTAGAPAWKGEFPEAWELMSHAAVVAELARLQAKFTYNGTFQIVDVVRRAEECRVWGEALRAEMVANGYSAIPRDQRTSAHAMELRTLAVAVADAAVAALAA